MARRPKLRRVRVLDPIPNQPSCFASYRETIPDCGHHCASAASGYTRAPRICARAGRHL